MNIRETTDQRQWDAFLSAQTFRPFLQSWTMGEVYKEIGQAPVRIEAVEGNQTVGIAFGHVVPARRGRHLSVPYGPVCSDWIALPTLIEGLKEAARQHNCAFVRMSPFWPKTDEARLREHGGRESPLHLLGEHIWYLPLRDPDVWSLPPPVGEGRGGGIEKEERGPGGEAGGGQRKSDELFSNLRATHRNLIRRAQKEGVTIQRSSNPTEDIVHFLKLHEETRKRHGFTPYTDAFFRAQLQKFSEQGQATLYLAWYQGQVIASSMHMHAFGETSYHHGASTHAFSKIPASYLLQWTAIEDAIKRGDHVYNFWGIAPMSETSEDQSSKINVQKNHPFAGVTMFKTGFNGKLLTLAHCMDIPLTSKYWLTWGFEQLRKRKRGF